MFSLEGSSEAGAGVEEWPDRLSGGVLIGTKGRRPEYGGELCG